MSEKLLIVEDDKKLNDGIRLALKNDACNIGKCSKAGAFPALWWLSRTVYSGECLKVPEKCGM